MLVYEITTFVFLKTTHLYWVLNMDIKKTSKMKDITEDEKQQLKLNVFRENPFYVIYTLADLIYYVFLIAMLFTEFAWLSIIFIAAPMLFVYLFKKLDSSKFRKVLFVDKFFSIVILITILIFYVRLL